MWIERLQQNLRRCKNSGLYRERHIVDSSPGLVNFSSNDYLGLRQDPRVVQAFIAGAQKYGLGSGASALVDGYSFAQAELEECFADFLQREKALLFNSGYHANLGVITALVGRNQQVLVDRLAHASIMDAIILSRAEYYRYAHLNTEDLYQHLSQSTSSQTMIISESIFSMEGDVAPVKPLADMAKKFNALLMIDDAHGIGILGENGGGICEREGLSQNEVPLLMAPLGKAFGSCGAIVAGSTELIDTFLQFSRTYCFTTALPPAIAFATLQSLKIVREETWRRQRLQELAEFFIREALRRDLIHRSRAPTPIQTIVIKNQSVLDLKNYLKNHGFLVAAIRPPTVPPGTSRLRISLSCQHNEKHILQLLDLLVEKKFEFQQSSCETVL